MNNEKIDLIELDREAEKIIDEAKKKAENIIKEAKRKANEKLMTPFPSNEIEHEKNKILEEAEKRAISIINDAENEIKKLRETSKRNYHKALDYVLRLVTGLDE